jgi:hypothetical protein
MAGILDQIAKNLNAQFNPEPTRPFAKDILRNDTDFGTGNIVLGVSPTQIVGPSDKRRSIKITNLAFAEVFLSNSPSTPQAFCDLLNAGRGQFNVYDTGSAIWAFAPSSIYMLAAVAWAEVY